jgi:hypothetical protein
MNFHSFTEYLKYRLSAKGRHGTHSPFVYKLVDECLLICNGQSLEKKLFTYFDGHILALTENLNPDQWKVAISTDQSEQIALIPGIHKTAAHTAGWKLLINNPDTKMSIDLFDYGLLISKIQFKEKQHFTLKYC